MPADFHKPLATNVPALLLSGELDPVTIDGTLAYLSNNNVWAMRGSSTSKRRSSSRARIRKYAAAVISTKAR